MSFADKIAGISFDTAQYYFAGANMYATKHNTTVYEGAANTVLPSLVSLIPSAVAAAATALSSDPRIKAAVKLTEFGYYAVKNTPLDPKRVLRGKSKSEEEIAADGVASIQMAVAVQNAVREIVTTYTFCVDHIDEYGESITSEATGFDNPDHFIREVRREIKRSFGSKWFKIESNKSLFDIFARSVKNSYSKDKLLKEHFTVNDLYKHYAKVIVASENEDEAYEVGVGVDINEISDVQEFLYEVRKNIVSLVGVKAAYDSSAAEKYGAFSVGVEVGFSADEDSGSYADETFAY